ncbi:MULTISPECIES: hypothetical protein [unclassified Exiguobacterium]|uniref:hypothetical protein n=1 Tax=unclassified Exiguobacterium TaxID=2644629 RepID=UPI001BE50C61|nr:MULTISPECIES: hypothetical protein [unclassified Exiguobacterium]
MKKGTLIECIDTVIMTDGVVAFVKGNQYKTYPYSFQSGWDEMRKVTCVKNDNGERHIVYDESREESKVFFNRHFKVVAK